MQISIKSPTRVDFAGGTLDCWPLYLLFDHCVTINLSVSIFTYVDLTPRTDREIHIEVADLGLSKVYSHLEEFFEDRDERLALVRRHLEFWKPQKGFHLKTRSESPVGGGLGGSSSMCIGLLKAFSQWLGDSAGKAETILRASNIEAQILKMPTGTQDYYPAYEAGLHVIQYGPWGARDECIPFPKNEFSDRMFLVYTGKPHHSGMNNWQVIKAALEGDSSVLAGLKNLRKVAFDLETACRKGEWEKLPDLFNREFEHRVALSPAFTCPEIESLKEVVLSSGGEAVKICGAGGGGCVMVWTPPSKKQQVWAECERKGFKVLNVTPVAETK